MSAPQPNKGKERLRQERERLFPDKKHVPFATDKNPGGFSALPHLYRALLPDMKTREWMILCCLIMHSNSEGVCKVEPRELAFDMGYGSLPKLVVHLKRLEEGGFISSTHYRGKSVFLLIDPTHIIATRKESLSEERLDLARDIHSTITSRKKKRGQSS